MEIKNLNKGFCLLLGFILVFSLIGFVVAEGPSTGINKRDVDKIQGAMNNIPLDNSGKIEYRPFRTKMEQRIGKINIWLDENVSWMKFLFHMKPKLSWLFIFNLYFILLFLTILVFNAEALWFFIEEKSHSIIFGLAVFVVFMVAGLYVGLANLSKSLVEYIFDVFIPSNIWLGVILLVVFFILFVFAYPVIGTIAGAIKTYFKAKREFKRTTEMKGNIRAVNTLINQIKKK